MGRRGSRWKPGDRPKGKDGLRERRITIEGRRYSLYASDPDTMQRLEDEKRAQVNAGIYKTNETITLDQYFPEWLAHKAANIKPTTLFNYKQCFINNISPYLGKCKVRRIERRQVVDMMEKVAGAKRKRGTPGTQCPKAKRKISAANLARCLLGSILKGAIADDIIQRNVVETVPQMKRDTPPARETIHRELTNEELKLFFSACAHSIYCPVFKFLLYTGVRAGECAGLKWLDVDWLRGIVHIRRTVTRNKEGHWIIGDTPKTKTSKRIIPMNTNVRKVLEKQWGIYKATHETVNLNDPVFPNEAGSYSNGGNYGEVVSDIIRRLKRTGVLIQRFGVHAFRDTFASRAIRSGVEPNTLKEIMGHASLAMTMDLYAHVSQDDKKKAMEKVEIANF